MPVEMTRARFEELVSEALDQVPPKFADAMDNVVVLVEEFNDESPTILGLYHGVALTRRTTNYGGVLPDRISIYRRPILWMCSTEAEVVEQVLITVMHELGHHFGLDDDRLHELGWG
ncbi:metallopeptidase family protein [Amycolatopsis sp. NPDC005232]|uniref:metallopeptidase family protein n=1 Tax=unclassified Amycolatopsis TaxID=2618356 RepID=UPI001C69F1C3|nr:metallopeptidase family protein [Amycolatopsis sp. DSM 110486]QYN24344.1 metallopeptidase family protein [Amycolatopsis sp. DSM 110486]